MPLSPFFFGPILGLALRPWRLAGWSQSFSALALAFLLTLGAFLLSLQANLRPQLDRLGRDQVLTAFLDPTVPAGDEKRVADQIRLSLGAKDLDIRGVGTQDFITALKPDYPALAQEVESLGDEGRDLVPRHVIIAGVLPEGAESSVKSVAGVTAIESSRGRYQQVLAAYQAVLRIAGWMLLGLALALVSGLFHLGRLNAQMHAESLSLLRLWGAHPILLRVPPTLSGLLVGAVGGLLAWALWVIAFPGLFEQLGKLSIVFRGLNAGHALAIGPWLAFAGLFLGGVTGLAAVLRRASA